MTRPNVRLASSVVPAASEVSIGIRRLREDEFIAAETLWYEVYVDEMKRTQSCADHLRRRLTDSLQSSAAILGAFCGNDLVGTVRVNYPRLTSMGYLESLYELAAFGPDHPSRTAVVTRIIVARNYRSSSVSVRLAANMFKMLVAENIRWILCDCNDGVLNFFLRLGFVVHRYDAPHPDYGGVTILKIDADDRRYHDPVKSILARFAY